MVELDQIALPLDGAEHMHAASTDERRRTGRVYTPEHLAHFVLEVAGYDAWERPGEAPVLDPACGAGVFLQATIARLAAALARRGVRLEQAQGARTFLDVVEACVFGVDVDPIACALAREAARAAAAGFARKRVPPGFLDRNVVAADFLLDDGALDRITPREAGGFAFIVGNPPYVSTTRLPEGYKGRLRARFATSSGRLDLYTTFMERGLDLLAEGGRLAFITPDKFLSSRTSAPLRGHLLARSALRVVARFDSHKVFEDAATVPCVTVFERGGERDDITVLQCRSDGERGTVTRLSSSTLSQASLGDAPWRLHSADARSLIARLEDGHPRVGQLTSRVSAGPASGRDKLFVFAEAEAPDVEPELLRPAIRGRDIEAFRLVDPRLRALVPYQFDAFGNGRLVRLEDFPRATRYLRSHRESLRARHCVKVWGRPWHEWHDPVTTDLVRQAKILVPDVANANRFAVDPGAYLPLHSAYYLVPKGGTDPHYMTGVLNSFVSEFIVRTLSPVVKDGFSRYRQQFVAALPVPVAPGRLAKQIAGAAREGDGRRVNDLVAELFALTARERDAIETALTRGRDGR